MPQTLLANFPAEGDRFIPAAQYVRMSTDDQQYSPWNQDDVNGAYAASRGMLIVTTYYDRARSGLKFEGRDALQQLIRDVQTREAYFQAILVYDVSRWGRAPNPDEAAYYEFICRRAGIAVHYPAEQFVNDDSSVSTILKSLKRVMAAEYSRELSAKVFAGQVRQARKGYKQGGPAGYGLRRLLVDQNGNAKAILNLGEWKCITTDRVVLVPGPPEEVAVVREVFSLFVHERKNEGQIENILNARGITNERQKPWGFNIITRMLRNEKYIGNFIWNRSSFKLHQARVDNDPSAWIRIDGAFEGIVDRALFEQAQEILRARPPFKRGTRPAGLTEAEMLSGLRKLLSDHGTLNVKLIDMNGETPAARAYYRQFGSILKAYELVGFKQRRLRQVPWTGRPRGRDLSDEEMLDGLRKLWRKHGNISVKLIKAEKSIPNDAAYYERFGKVTVAYQKIGFRHDPAKYLPLASPRGPSNEKILELVRDLLSKEGRLSARMLDNCPVLPKRGTLHYRFGGLLKLYELVGYKQDRYCVRPEPIRNGTYQAMLDGLRALLRQHGYISSKLILSTKTLPSIDTYRTRFGSIRAAYDLIGYTPLPGPRKGRKGSLDRNNSAAQKASKSAVKR